MEPFDVLNMGNISDLHLEHSNCYLFYGVSVSCFENQFKMFRLNNETFCQRHFFSQRHVSLLTPIYELNNSDSRLDNSSPV